METGKTVQDLNVGERASLSRVVSEEDLALFACATGDVNPIHFDQPYAEGTFFKGRIAHGMLSAGFLSAVIANRLPGLGTVYLSQNLKFLAPVRLGDTVTAEVEVLELDQERNRVRLRTTCTNQEGTLVLDGDAVVVPPKRKPSGEVAEALSRRAEKTDRCLAAATAAFAKTFQGEEQVGRGTGGEGGNLGIWTGTFLGWPGDLAKAFGILAEQGTRVQREGQHALSQWLDLLGKAGQEYLRVWGLGARRGDPS